MRRSIEVFRLRAERLDAHPVDGGIAGRDVNEWYSMCRALEASAAQLREIAWKASLISSPTRAAEREAYVAMMLGPLAALDRLRRQMTGT